MQARTLLLAVLAVAVYEAAAYWRGTGSPMLTGVGWLARWLR